MLHNLDHLKVSEIVKLLSSIGEMRTDFPHLEQLCFINFGYDLYTKLTKPYMKDKSTDVSYLEFVPTLKEYSLLWLTLTSVATKPILTEENHSKLMTTISHIASALCAIQLNNPRW